MSAVWGNDTCHCSQAGGKEREKSQSSEDILLSFPLWYRHVIKYYERSASSFCTKVPLAIHSRQIFLHKHSTSRGFDRYWISRKGLHTVRCKKQFTGARSIDRSTSLHQIDYISHVIQAKQQCVTVPLLNVFYTYIASMVWNTNFATDGFANCISCVAISNTASSLLQSKNILRG